MQFDMFAEEKPQLTEREKMLISAEEFRTPPVLVQTEKLRPQPMQVIPIPTGAAELDHWTRETQRIYLLYLVGAIQRFTYRDSSIENVRYVLMKLNGLGGEW